MIDAAGEVAAIAALPQSPSTPNWLNDYLRGAGMEMYTETLSASFVGMTFPEAANLLYTKLELLLMALEVQDTGQHRLWINPGSEFPVHSRLTASALRKGFRQMITKAISPAGNGKIVSAHNEHYHVLSTIPTHTISSNSGNDILTHETLLSNGDDSSTNKVYDSTGMFHWCYSQRIEECILDRHQKSLVLHNHVVVCLFADKGSPLIGLRNFVMPLRASNFHYHELKRIVIVGDVEYIRREWKTLYNMPKLSILHGSPLSRSDLRAANINTCDMCVIISARIPNPNEDPTLADKEAILASLNVKAMHFDDQPSHSINSSFTMSAHNSYNLRQTVITDGTQVPMITEL
uniref:Calcium-activated potassium channel BK alpha subunit domain-containing protein n=1 Tax=Romanomermis culicivorax TaxID=13658 RepID=A0A915L323_ROMCU